MLARTVNMTPDSAWDAMVIHSQESQGSSGMEQVRLIAGLCDFGAETHSNLLERKINGNATDQATLRFSELLGSVLDLRQLWGENFEFGFNSKNQL